MRCCSLVSVRHRALKQGFKRLTHDLSFALKRVLQVAEALDYLHNRAIPGDERLGGWRYVEAREVHHVPAFALRVLLPVHRMNFSCDQATLGL